jgi:hypothetical protein
MDSPGGYQLVGRTLPIWNTFGRAGPFTAQKPWLLEFFDQVGAQEMPSLNALRAQLLRKQPTDSSGRSCVDALNSLDRPCPHVVCFELLEQ